MLLSSATCGSAAAAAQVATHTSWRGLWDIALDRGEGDRHHAGYLQGTVSPNFAQLRVFQCSLCEARVSPNSSCLEQLCTSRPSEMGFPMITSFLHLQTLLSPSSLHVNVRHAVVTYGPSNTVTNPVFICLYTVHMP